MSRIEKYSSREEQRTELQREIRSAVGRSGANKKAAGCLLLLGLTLVLLLGVLLWVSLATGIVTVPEALLEWYREG